MIIFALLGNAANLIIPTIISRGIDTYTAGNYVLKNILWEFMLAIAVIFVFSILQMVVQTYASERVGFDLRKETFGKNIAAELFLYSEIQPVETAHQPYLRYGFGKAVCFAGSNIHCFFSLYDHWHQCSAYSNKLETGNTCNFNDSHYWHLIRFCLQRAKVYFRKSREVVDWLNKVINESI
jgi:ATP-binding cassette, subfamily B, bacterial